MKGGKGHTCENSRFTGNILTRTFERFHLGDLDVDIVENDLM
jgi:hypothetical protein